jgi:signal transduction histidine kinase
MSLGLRLALLLSAVVMIAVALAGAVMGGAILRPFTRQVMDVYLDQAVFVAERVARGEDPVALGRELGLELRLRDRPPPTPGAGPLRGRPCRDEERRGHRLVFCRGPRAPVSVETTAGWVTIKRDLDVAEPVERSLPPLLVVMLGLVGVAFYVARVATKPLLRTTRAVAKVAAGDLDERLPTDEGPRELREAAETFNAMTRRLRQMLETERALMAGVSHELRTPLARLRLGLELLPQDAVPPARRAAMERDLEELDALIGELLEASRLSVAERRLELGETDLFHVAEDAVARVDDDPGTPIVLGGSGASIDGDHERLVRVVVNLIRNARRHAASSPEIQVRVAGTTLTVDDRGPGVPEAELERIFQPFYRSGGASPGGVGLGLALARQITLLHGGELRASNRDGGGLRMTLTLPPSVERGRDRARRPAPASTPGLGRT